MENQSEIITPYGTFKAIINRPKVKNPPLVVLFHGFPDDSTVWGHQIHALKSDFEVCVPDLYQHSFLNQVRGMASYLEAHLGGRKAILIGHDMGGPLACELARENPELISKVLLINTLSLRQFIGRWKEPRQWIKSVYMPFFAGPLHNTSWWKRAGKFLVKSAYDKGGLDKDDPLRENSLEVLEGIKRYREIGKELPQNVMEMERRLLTETHFLFGLTDPFLVTPDLEELNRHFSNATLELLPTGHWPQRTCAGEVNNWIKKVINHG